MSGGCEPSGSVTPLYPELSLSDPQLLKLPEFCLRAARVEDCGSQAADGGGEGSEATGKQQHGGMVWGGDSRQLAARSPGQC